jgi:hypothetical protein
MNFPQNSASAKPDEVWQIYSEIVEAMWLFGVQIINVLSKEKVVPVQVDYWYGHRPTEDPETNVFFKVFPVSGQLERGFGPTLIGDMVWVQAYSDESLPNPEAARVRQEFNLLLRERYPLLKPCNDLFD